MKGIVCGMEISMATTEELLQTILQSLEKVEYIKSEDIPNRFPVFFSTGC